jgi:hypothetical protein
MFFFAAALRPIIKIGRIDTCIIFEGSSDREQCGGI